VLQNYHQPQHFVFYHPYNAPFYQNPCIEQNTTQGDRFGAFYCSANEGIYFSEPWVQRWLDNCNEVYSELNNMPACFDNDSNANTTGDWAFGVVLAHEWGHHVQHLMGWPYQRRKAGEYAHFELQADCFAGIATRYLYNQGMVTQEDIAEATYWFANAGDRPGTPWYDSGAHGSPDLRVAWFRAGVNQYSVRVCNQVFN
jgi:predicted metalloprotease